MATDDAQTLLNKAEARRAVLQGMKNESVGAYEQLQQDLAVNAAPQTTSYIDSVESQLDDPYSSLLSAPQTSTSAIAN